MERNAVYDYARLMAAFGIVVFHAGAPGATIGYAALPFFLMLLMVMAVPAITRSPFQRYAATRRARLLRPWLIWSGLFAALKLAEVALTGRPLSSEFQWTMLLTGPAIHLWFLPFAFCACLALYPLVRRAPTRLRYRFALGCALTGAALAAHALRQDQSLAAPLAQWAYALPAVFLGGSFALLRAHPGDATLLMGGFVGVAALADWTAGLPQLALAAGAMIFCAYVHLPVTALSRLSAQTAMGVYLAHPLVFSVLERTTTLSPTTILFAGVASFGAFGIALLWHRIEVRTLPQHNLVRV